MRNRFLPAALVLSLLLPGALARAADEQPAAAKASASIVGRWKVTTQGRNRAMERELVITQQDAKLAGVLKAPATPPQGLPAGIQMRDQQVQDISLAGDSVSFAIVRERNGQTRRTVYQGTLKGDRMEGTITSPMANNPRKWTAVRMAAEPAGLTGTWKISMQGPNRTFERDLVLTQKGKTVTGVMKAPAVQPQGLPGGFRMQDQEIQKGTFDAGVLTFALSFGRNGQTREITYKANLKGDTLEGEVQFGNNSRPWKATRAAQSPTAVAGQWDLTITTPERTYTPKLTLTQEGGKLGGSLVSDSGERMPLKSASLTGKTVKFAIDLAGQNGTTTMEFEATIDGDSLKGQVNSPMGAAPMTGKRAKPSA